MRILLATLLVTITGVCSAQSDRAPADRPNIVILFADDLGYGDLGSYGHPYIRTPNLDALAAEGQRWTDFYVAAALCSPSRGALLTGRYPVRTGLYGRRIGVMFPDDTVGMPEHERTMAEALRERGYATTIIGKWHLGDAPDFLPTRHGFDSWTGIPYSNDMKWALGPSPLMYGELRAQGRADEVEAALAARAVSYKYPRIEEWNAPLMSSRVVNGRFEDTIVAQPAPQTELTKQATEQAIAFIESNQEQPFLLYMPYTMPHTPVFRSEAFVDRSLAGYYGDVIEELDWSVGQITSRLESLGLADNTLVLFTSDNGPWLTMNEHSGSAGMLRHGKSTTFEGGMRVPAVFSWPGQIEPAVISDIGTTLDVFATVLALAGAEPGNDIDGVDLTRTLLEAAPGPRERFAYYRAGELRAFRKGDFKLHLITEGAYGLPPERTDHAAPLLYNLRTDVAERLDVAAEHPDIVADIMATIEAHREAMTIRPPIFDSRLSRN
jgi:arylsulfatase A